MASTGHDQTEPSTRLRPAVAAVLIGVVLGSLFLVLGLGSWPGTYYSLIRVASIVVALVGLVVWLVIAIVRPEHRPASGLMGAFAAALFAFAISALQRARASVSPSTSSATPCS